MAGIVLIAVGAFVFSGSSKGVTGNVIIEDPSQIQGEVQRVTLSTKNFNYYPEQIEVEANKPVEITLDKTVTGCFRSFTIRDLGVSKYAKTPADKIIFTPTKKGTFTFACSMGMGFGKIVVE